MFCTLIHLDARHCLAQAPTVTDTTLLAIPAVTYQDKLIDAASISPGEALSEPEYRADGWPRSWRIEGFSSNFKRSDGTTHENGLTFGGRLDTPEYGAFSLDGAVRGRASDSLLTLWQRGMPFDGGWRANNGLGMLNTPALELSRTQYRFYLPTFPIAGISTEWQQGRETLLQASVGEPGLFNGLRLSGFARSGGTMVTGGAQTMLDVGNEAAVKVGVQFINAQGVQTSVDPGETASRTSARSWFAGLERREGNTRLQFNMLDSELNHNQHRFGIWMDGETRIDRYRHNYGVFKLEPELFWGYSAVAADAEGAYYRLNYQSQQWQWTVGMDSVNSITGTGVDGLAGTGTLRYQVSRTLGVGGGATVRHANADARSAYAFIDKQSLLGASRVQVDTASVDGGGRSELVTVDQSWPTEIGLRLSTSLSTGKETNAGNRIRRSSFAVIGSADVTNSISFDANLRWSRNRTNRNGGLDSGSSLGRYANVSMNWRIDSRWSMSMTYYDNRSEQQEFLTVGALIPAPILMPTPKDRALFLIVRYEDRAGTPVAPLGGSPGSGAGGIFGLIYLDNNDNGRRDADENGAANVTILLDGKFSTRTDNLGRFEFPLVASGNHTIFIVSDNLPLPYSIAEELPRRIVVRTRENTELNIAATKAK